MKTETLELIAIFLIVLALSACGSSSKGEPEKIKQEGWSDLTLKAVKDGCTESLFSSKKSEHATVQKIRSFCSCVMDEMSYKFTYRDFYNFPVDTSLVIREEYAKSCSEKSDLYWDDTDGISLEVEFFYLSDKRSGMLDE